jgi:hypothetical protein
MFKGCPSACSILSALFLRMQRLQQHLSRRDRKGASESILIGLMQAGEEKDSEEHRTAKAN